jgi:glutathione synthase/RimK-type ligase-like ATP-grasp enzyme
MIKNWNNGSPFAVILLILIKLENNHAVINDPFHIRTSNNDYKCDTLVKKFSISLLDCIITSIYFVIYG